MHELPANPHHFRLVINRVPTSFQAPILMTYTRTLVLIPARMASTRLPDKPLLDIAGLPMIVHVLRQAEAAQIGRVAVATDAPEIAAAVTAHGGEAVMTRADHPSGSDRIYEALCKLDPGGQIEAVVNVQGDLPTIPAHDIRGALMLLEDSRVDIGTLVAESRKEEEHTTPSVVKLVGSPMGDQRLRALYFTRATAPYGDGPRYHHIGLYAYRREALERFVKLPPSVLEQREKLEQLRALEAGMRIDAAIVEAYPDAEPLPCPTFEDALAAIASGEADLGMIPIENSVAGRVADIHHLLPQSGLFIVGEWFQPIHHQLMAPRGAKLADIKTVESHVHALGQCRRIIRKLGIKPIVSADTAGSARIVAERGDKSYAAIASKLAADIYGLDILAEDVEDETHNTTRFVVLAREANWAKQGSGPLVTTFVFRVRNLPAALYKALGGFATNGVNMTKLESYMIDGNFFATQFYADVDGHPDDKGLAFALEELKFFSREFRIVGVYPGHPFRATFSEKQD